MAEKCRSTRKNSCKISLFEALAKLQDAVKKRPVFHNYLVVKNEENSCKIREFFFLLKHPTTTIIVFQKKKKK